MARKMFEDSAADKKLDKKGQEKLDRAAKMRKGKKGKKK